MDLATRTLLTLDAPDAWHATRTGFWHPQDLHAVVVDHDPETPHPVYRQAKAWVQILHRTGLARTWQPSGGNRYLASLRPQRVALDPVLVMLPEAITSLEHFQSLMDLFCGPSAWALIEALQVLLGVVAPDSRTYLGTWERGDPQDEPGHYFGLTLWKVITWLQVLDEGKVIPAIRLMLPTPPETQHARLQQRVQAEQARSVVTAWMQRAPIDTTPLKALLAAYAAIALD